MAGPMHNFLLSSGDGNWGYNEYKARIRALMHRSDGLTIPDSLFVYMDDTFKWIPSINPANPTVWPGYGLNQLGPTVINKEGTEVFEGIFRSWALIFENAPARLRLTDRYVRGRYQYIELDRDPLVRTLHSLADYAVRVRSEHFFVLHLGI